MTWHADARSLERYAGGDLDAANSFSVEAHLLACDECRRRLPRDAERLQTIWTGVRVTIDAPKKKAIERLLGSMGISEHAARVLAATPALSMSWTLGVAVSLIFAIVASHNRSGNPLPFLLIAPVLPLVGVATAYGPGIDPTYEIGASSPMRGLRLLMLRSIAVFATTSVLAAAASFALPHVDLEAAAWVLPALALATVCLALSTWLTPVRAAVVVAAGWAAVAIASVSVATGPLRAQTVVSFREGGQVLFAVASVVALIVFVMRRDRFERIDGS